MSVSNPMKVIDTAALTCSGTATVTLSFDAAPELQQNPADIILLMDRSGSMTAERMTFAKAAARQLIETVALASGGTPGGPILNGSRLGVISFADDAVQDVALTEEVPPLNSAIDALARGGFTNHKAAFEAARQMLDPQSGSRQVVIMFTDGQTTVGGDALPAAQSLKNAGAEIFCIGLTVDPAILNAWASDPDGQHVAYTDDPARLAEVFRQVTAEVVLAGAMDVAIREQLNPDFKLVRVNTPTQGAVQVIGQQTLIWTMDAVGLVPGTTSLSFEIMHIGADGGTKAVNQSLGYEDRAGTALTFPTPTVDVRCDGPVIIPEPCPLPTFFHVGPCQDSVVMNLPRIRLQSLGRIVQVDATVENVCPGKRVAVAILLTEEGPNGEEYARGTKTVLLPALTGDQCQDVTLKCIHFVVPESLDADGSAASICNSRKFNARVLANYIDTDFVCCDTHSVII